METLARRWLLMVPLTLTLLAGCTTDDKKDPLPLPSVPVGKLACGFVAEESIARALGTTDIDSFGSMPQVVGTTNPDGSRLSMADCTFSTGETAYALRVDVEQLGIAPAQDEAVLAALAAGKPPFVFPAAEGQGYAAGDTPNGVAGIAHLIRGDWRYRVYVKEHTVGRDSIADVVAITRQVVAQLNLPKVGKLPRPTVTPSK